jgi:hypothetical protein
MHGESPRRVTGQSTYTGASRPTPSSQSFRKFETRPIVKKVRAKNSTRNTLPSSAAVAASRVSAALSSAAAFRASWSAPLRREAAGRQTASSTPNVRA